MKASDAEIEIKTEHPLEPERRSSRTSRTTENEETHSRKKVAMIKEEEIDTTGALVVQKKMIDYQDQVLEYLRKQELYFLEEHIDIEEFEIVKESPEVIQDTAREVLMQLLSDVNNITSFKEAYEEEKKRNNQFELFDLAKIIPGFHINDDVMEQLAFRENLVVSKVHPKGHVEPVGGLSLDVQMAQGAKWDQPTKVPDFTKALMEACADIKEKIMTHGSKGEMSKVETDLRQDLEEYMEFLEEEMKKNLRKFLIHMSSQFDVDGNNAGSRMTAWVDRNLHTLEEKRREFIKYGDEEDQMDQKQLYVYIGRRHYDIKIQRVRDRCCRCCYSFRRAKEYVGEAANFILMRYLAITKYIGEFELSTIHIDGGLCRNIYLCEGPMSGIINNEKMDLCKIYRTIIEECGIVHRSSTMLSLDGRIMKHDWEGCDYVLQIYPNISPKKKQLTSILHYEENWRWP